MKHGWTAHGWPCCNGAPLAERPDVVTACPMALGVRTMVCVECSMTTLRMHMRIEVPSEQEWRQQWYGVQFPILTDEDFRQAVREAGERLGMRAYSLNDPSRPFRVTGWTSS